MFTWPYFDLSQIWNLSFFLEGHPVSWFWHFIWTSFFHNWSMGALQYLCGPIAWFVIAILFIFALGGTIFLWIPL